MNSEQLIQYFSEVVEEVFDGAVSASNLLEDKNKTSLLQSIFDALDRLGIAVSEVIPTEITTNYMDGIEEASRLLFEEKVISATAAGQTATMMKKHIHLEAVSEIVDDTLLDLEAAIRTAKKSAKANINKTLNDIRADIAKGLIKGDSNSVVTKRVAQSFLKNGLTSFTTSDGKQLPLDFYAKTVTKTKMKVANVTGAINRYQENGVDLVKINEHHPTCPVCARNQGMVISLTGNHPGFKSVKEVSLPPWHPHCEHSVRPYVLKNKTEEEIQAEKDKWKKWNPEKDTRTEAQKKAYEKEQSIRRVANQEKKQYARMKAMNIEGLPKTLGAFRRKKRANDESWKRIQSEYLSATKQL